MVGNHSLACAVAFHVTVLLNPCSLLKNVTVSHFDRSNQHRAGFAVIGCFVRPNSFRAMVKTGFGFLGCLIVVLVYEISVASAESRIDLIELLHTNQVVIHFNTKANKTTALQYVDSLSCDNNSTLCGSVVSRGWSNLFVAPNFPFFNHYVIADTRTNMHRFYRLKVE